jgi:hypothetical protein
MGQRRVRFPRGRLPRYGQPEPVAAVADVAFASHHWPTWGHDKVIRFLSEQRDLYAYLHDQTLRMLNQGYTGMEIAELIQLPHALDRAWHARGYYGSVSHDVKAIYQRYMGWFDGLDEPQQRRHHVRPLPQHRRQAHRRRDQRTHRIAIMSVPVPRRLPRRPRAGQSPRRGSAGGGRQPCAPRSRARPAAVPAARRFRWHTGSAGGSGTPKAALSG